MLEQLKKEVCEANIELVKKKLVIYTWGNVSAIDRKKNLVVIKPSGIDYDKMTPDDMTVVDLMGNRIEGDYKPSSDTPTHLALYKKYGSMGSIVHTHSAWAVAFAQAGMSIPAYGTTHADYFYGDVPCTRDLTKDEIEQNYELNTGRVIIECIRNKDPLAIPAILVKNHGPFTWGEDAKSAVYNAVVLETIAEMAFKTIVLNQNVNRVPQHLLDKHYYRKHGANAYYGQDH